MNHETMYAAKLKAMFEQIEPQLRDEQVRLAKHRALAEFDAWVARLNGPKPAPLENGPVYNRDKPAGGSHRWAT